MQALIQIVSRASVSVLFLVTTGAAMAGDLFEPDQLTSPGWHDFFSELLRSVDVIVFLMTIFFIVLLGMCIDLFFHLRVGRLIPESLLNDVQEEMSSGEYEKALEVSQKSDSLTGEVFVAALGKTDFSFERMSESMRAEVKIQGLAWRQWVDKFRTIAMIALLLGLAGFLIETMRFIAEMAGRPSLELALASSFELRALAYSAMLSLLIGAIMAVISLSVATYASSKLEKILLEAERLGEELLDPFRPLPLSQEDMV